MKRETSISVTDLHNVSTISDSVKRISLRDKESGSVNSSATQSPVPLSPGNSPLGVDSAGSATKNNLPVFATMQQMPSLQSVLSGDKLKNMNSHTTTSSSTKSGTSSMTAGSTSMNSINSGNSNFVNDNNVVINNNGNTMTPQGTHLLHRGDSISSDASTIREGTVLDKLSSRQAFLNKYEFIKEIGRGGFSKVYQCKDKKFNNDFAVKVIDLRPLRLRENFDPARLRREVDIMSKLKHPRIIQFYEGFETEEQMMMVLEYCPGKELFDVILERKRFSERDAKPVFAQICSALFYLHSLNIIHRDVKPENVLVLNECNAEGDLSVKLLDFGLSKNAGAGSAAKTFVGTPCYLAPEVEYTSKGLGGTYGLPADCWSLGAVLYVMLVARFPEFEQDVNGKIVLKLPSALWSGISQEAQNLVRSLMDTNQHARLTTSGAAQHPWLEEYRSTREELAEIVRSTYALGEGLQDELDDEMDADTTVTAGGANVTRTDMVLRRGHEFGHSRGPVDQLQLSPLMRLQQNIATCFADVHAAITEMPEISAQIRRGAVLCREQFKKSVQMLYKVEQTSVAVLEMFPDLELAVEEGEPQLATEFFSVVKGWVTELRTSVTDTQQTNKMSMAQIQSIVETSASNLQSSANNRRIPSVTVPSRMLNLVTGGSNEGDSDNDGDVTLTADQLYGLFNSLFDSKVNASKIEDRAWVHHKQMGAVDTTSTAADDSFVEDIDMDEVVDTSAKSGSSGNNNNNYNYNSSSSHQFHNDNSGSNIFNSGSIQSLNSDSDVTTELNITPLVIPDQSTAVSKSGVGTPTTIAATNRLTEALQKLYEVDMILEQISAFWANTELVLDVLTKKGEHAEQFIGFASKPRLMARFKERLEEYKRFWENVNGHCKAFINNTDQSAAGGDTNYGFLEKEQAPTNTQQGPNSIFQDNFSNNL
jgi:serine/threonine protein kinase